MKVTQNGFLSFALALLCSTALAVQAPAQSRAGAPAGIRTVVLDPGHGGDKPGCVSGSFREKDITLKVALMLGRMIEENYPEVKVIYTRTTDKDVDLAERGNIANRAGADLFLSIHVDAVANKAATGTSSWVMGLDKNKANLDVAMRENEVAILEDDYSVKYAGFDPDDPDSYIIFSLMQYVYGEQSMQFASMIQRHYTKNTGLPDRGARQAPYLVLWKTTMPAVLTEIGFLSNDRDRKFVTSKAGQEKIAVSIFNAFGEYKSKVEGRANPIVLTARMEEDDDEAEATAGAAGAQPDAGSEYIFTVQISSSTKKIPLGSPSFRDYKGQVVERKIGKLYKYYVGECASYSEAVSLQKKVRRSFGDAFVTAFRGTEPVGANEARRALGQ